VFWALKSLRLAQTPSDVWHFRGMIRVFDCDSRSIAVDDLIQNGSRSLVGGLCTATGLCRAGAAAAAFGRGASSRCGFILLSWPSRSCLAVSCKTLIQENVYVCGKGAFQPEGVLK